MKKILFLAFLGLSIPSLNAQDFKAIAKIEMESKADFKENEENAFECAEYLLKSAYKKDDYNRLVATQFLLKWMTGAEMTFELGDDFLNFAGGNDQRMEIYIATLVYAALEGDTPLTPEQINERARVLFLQYCLDHEEMKRNKHIKKALKAMKE